jgi:hypothetical protein
MAEALVTRLSSGHLKVERQMNTRTQPWTALLRCAAVTAVIVGGLGELAALQRWRLRDWLLRHSR